MDKIKELIKGVRKIERTKIALKLIKRANHFMKHCKNPESPIILVASELKIQADEIYLQSD